MAEGTPKPFANFALPGVLLALLGLYAYLIYEPPLRSSRPKSLAARTPEPPSGPVIRNTYGRLWQDPLTTAMEHHAKAGETTARPPPGTHVADLQSHFAQVVRNLPADGRFVCLTVLVSGEPYLEDQERRGRTQTAVFTALSRLGFKLQFSTKISYIAFPLRIDIRRQGSTNRQYEESFVVPIKLFEWDELEERDPPSLSGHSDASGPSATAPKAKVLVNWVNESQLGSRPLCVLGQIYHVLFGGLKAGTETCRIDLAVLGPSNSDTLLLLSQENAAWKTWNAESRQQTQPRPGDPAALRTSDVADNGFLEVVSAGDGTGFFRDFGSARIYANLATFDPSLLPREGAPAGASPGGLGSSGFSVVRAIGTDMELARALAEELRIRGAWEEDIVLISERDTLYGRALEKAFRETAARESGPPIHAFRYLRGIDGKIPGDDADAPSNTAENGRDASQSDRYEVPFGRPQNDYLRRLEEAITLHSQALRRNGRHAGAIGIFGTDLYDKLLILRALKGHFPRTVFFTTDLDARAFQKSELPHTRNLVIASHFDLRLAECWQRDVPWFRDSYQTATFYATLLAIAGSPDFPAESVRLPLSTDPPHGKSFELSPPLQVLRRFPVNPSLWDGIDLSPPPLLYELGRQGPFLLGQAPFALEHDRQRRRGFGSALHPPDSWAASQRGAFRSLAGLLLGSAGLVAIGSLLTGAAPAWPGLRAATAAAVRRFQAARSGGCRLCVLAAILFLAMGIPLTYYDQIRTAESGLHAGEPFLLLGGLSVWPSTALRCFALFLGVCFLTLTQKRLRTNREELVRSYHLQAGEWANQPALREIAAQLHAPADLTRSVAVATALYLGLAWLFFRVTEPPNNPARGGLAAAASSASVSLAVVLMIGLLFFVSRHAFNCVGLVRSLGRQPVPWPPPAVEELAPGPTELALERCDWTTVRFIADRTASVERLALCPAVLLLLLLVSRLSVFDDWNLPVCLVTSMLVTAAIAFLSMLSVRLTSARARDRILARIHESILRREAVPDNRPLIDGLQRIAREIGQERRGAFRPWVRDPVFQAFALPFGEAGGLVLLEQWLQYF